MLTHLQLRDLVIVDSAELNFESGLTALTGETGAGKSIVVDALLLIAGGRAAGDVVRHGADRADIAASFAALPPPAVQWLDAQDIDHDGEVIIRRVIGADGRSRAYLNGNLVPLQQLREFAEFLLEIHGQQEFQHLVKRSAQRELLDEHLAAGLIGDVAESYDRYRECRREYDALRVAAQNRDARLDLLRHQLVELRAEVTTPLAIDELFVEQKRVSARGRLGGAARIALTAVYEADADSAHDLLSKAQGALRTAAEADPQLAEPAQQLAEAAILTQEAADTLRRYLDNLDMDPARQEEIERHAAALEGLARKHRLPVMELPAQRERIEVELRALENAAQSLTELEHRLMLLTMQYRAAAQRLSRARTAGATNLSALITRLMQDLGMSGGRFAVRVESNDTELGSHGSDQIEFLVSANPGQPLKSLAKVASGGELSRISLAVQVAAAAKETSPCMVFDEIDAGIGGGIAEIVGRQLRALGEHSQVLCVTHLAQVASQAHSQFQVIKHTDGKMTRTEVKNLAKSERIDEVARMLGGVEITAQARAHAREMLDSAVRPAATTASTADLKATAPPKKKRARGA